MAIQPSPVATVAIFTKKSIYRRYYHYKGMLGRLTGLALASTVAGSYWYRPIPPNSEERNEMGALSSRTSSLSLTSKLNPADECWDTPRIIYLGRLWLTPLIVTMSRLFLRLANTFEVRRDAHYDAFLDAVVGRESTRPLITVSNHRSLMDDPPLLSNILPYHVGIQPKYLRFGACAQEFCYKDNMPGIVYAFMGSGRSMPIKRGGGINQKMWHDFARHAAIGEWIHIFPEAGIWQHPDGRLGGRDNAGWRGKLKWGVGKLIAHSPVSPVIIPFHHMGMEHVMPQNPLTRKTITLVPNINAKVFIKFGGKIYVDDLIQEHERKHGPLRKFSPSFSADKLSKLIKDGGLRQSPYNSSRDIYMAQVEEDWKSSPAEEILYNKITARIEEALQGLAPNR